MEGVPVIEAVSVEPFAVREPIAMQLVGMKRTLFKAYVAAGEIPSFTVGGIRLFPVAGLKAWVEARAARATTPPGSSQAA